MVADGVWASVAEMNRRKCSRVLQSHKRQKRVQATDRTGKEQQQQQQQALSPGWAEQIKRKDSIRTRNKEEEREAQEKKMKKMKKMKKKMKKKKK